MGLKEKHSSKAKKRVEDDDEEEADSEETGGKRLRVEKLSDKEKRSMIAQLLEDLGSEEDQKTKSQIRQRLRKLGHTGGLRVTRSTEEVKKAKKSAKTSSDGED